jgi:hypothetical protein
MNVADYLKAKNIEIFSSQTLLITKEGKNISLFDLLNEYAQIYSKDYLCFSKTIDLIDNSNDLKEFEVNVNRFFKCKDNQ